MAIRSPERSASDFRTMEIRLLGGFHVFVDGQPIAEEAWSRPKPRLLLKLLALQPRHRLHREKLLEYLWPDQDIVSATKNLHRALHIARRALEPQLTAGDSSQFIITEGQQIVLQASGQLRVDVIEFEQRAAEALKSHDLMACEAVLSLYEGDLLPEDLHQDWATVRREQLRTLHRSLLVRTAQLLEKSGHYQQSVAHLKTLIGLEPADEEAHRRLMYVYALMGDRHLAVQQYRQCAELLRRELDTRPDELTTALYEQIIGGKIKSAAVPSASAAGAPPAHSEAAAQEPSPDISSDTADTAATTAPVNSDKATASFINITEAPAQPDTVAPQVIQPSLSHPEPAERLIAAAPPRARFFRHPAFTGMLLMLVLSLAAGVFLFTPRNLFTLRSQAIDSLAILPLINDGTEHNLEYLSDGLTESLINSLSSLPNLRVTARSTAFRYKSRNVDALNAGQQLGVRAVLTGRVTQQGDLLTIKAELVDVSDGSRIWAETYQRRLSDLVALQTELSWEISDKLKLKLEGDEKERVIKRFTRDSAAYQLYLRGRYYWNRRNAESVRKAVEYYEQAIRQDPDYALAHVGLADAYAVWPDDSVTRRETAEAAKAAATKALTLDNNLPEAHTSLAFSQMLLDRDMVSAEQSFRRSLDLNPNYATAHHWYAYNLAALNRLNDAISAIRKAQELDPASLSINNDVSEILFYTRQYDQAISQSRKTLALDDSFTPAHQMLGLALIQKGMYQDGIAQLRQALAMSAGNTYVAALLGYGCAMAGRRDEAEMILRELQGSASQKYVSPYHLALIQTALGNQEQAMTLLEQADNEKVFSVLLLKVDPRLDRLRDHPRFAALLQRIRFQ